MIIVLTTVPDHALGETLATAIVEKGFAACVQIMPPMTSVYRWKGEIHKEPEHLLLIKTIADKWPDLRDFINANHTYDVPEIIAVKSEYASMAYLDWLENAVEN